MTKGQEKRPDAGQGTGGPPQEAVARRGPDRDPADGQAAGQLGRSTALFSIATGASRLAGLVREIFAASYFGVSGAMTAFTAAFQVPNLIRMLFADVALQAAFVPVFTEQLEQGNKASAFRLASTLLFLVTVILGLITAVFILAAPVVMPLFVPGLEGETLDLTIALSQLLFPILVMLGISGVVVGVLNSYHRFGIFAIAPLFWNIAIIAVLVGLAPAFPEGEEIYAYAIGVLVGTLIQLAMVAYDLRNTPFSLRRVFAWRSDLVKKVLILMLPVTISLGLINFNLSVNTFFGTLVSEQAPAAIDKAFRIYMLPQGMFSVAVATVVFPTLARFAARRAFDDLRSTLANGMRMIMLVLLPAAAAILVLSEPMTRLVYERGDFDAASTELVSTALFWFAFSLPFNGIFLLMTRTFFSLQRPWVPTAIAGVNLLITAAGSAALYEEFEIAGIVAATALATAVSVVMQAVILRRQLGGIELRSLLDGTIRIGVASALLAGVTYLAWSGLDSALGDSTFGQIGAVGIALSAGGIAYLGAVLAMRVPEAQQILRLVRR